MKLTSFREMNMRIIRLIWMNINNYHYCDIAWIIIPGRESILCAGDVEGSLALDPPQNKSKSRLLFRAYGKLSNNVEVNLGLDWSQTLVWGYQFIFTYTTRFIVFLPTQIAEERASGWENINCSQISKIPL